MSILVETYGAIAWGAGGGNAAMVSAALLHQALIWAERAAPVGRMGRQAQDARNRRPKGKCPTPPDFDWGRGRRHPGGGEGMHAARDAGAVVRLYR